MVPVPRKQSINLDLGRGSIVMAWDSEVLVLIAQSSVAFIRKRSAQRLDLPAMGVVREHSSRWLWCDRSWLSLDWSYEKDVVPDNEIIVFAAKSRQADIKGQVHPEISISCSHMVGVLYLHRTCPMEDCGVLYERIVSICTISRNGCIQSSITRVRRMQLNGTAW